MLETKKKIRVEDLPDKVIAELFDNPVYFSRIVFNVYLWSMQRKIAYALKEYKRVCVYSCTGMGKSFVEAILITWFLQTHPNSVVILTGSVFKQVKRTVWRSIIDLYSRARVKLLGEPSAEVWNVTKGQWYAEMLSGRKIEAMQGIHAPYFLAVIDEGSGVEDYVFDAISGNLSGGDSYLLVCGNPLRPQGEFYRLQFDPSFIKFRVSVFDTPMFTGEIEKIPYPYKEILEKVLPTPKWVREMRLRYGEDSLFWKAKILALFPDEYTERGLFTVDLIENAFKRQVEPKDTDKKYITVDVAGYGDDLTVISLWHGFKQVEMLEYAKLRTNEVATEIARISAQFRPDYIIVDSTGLGAGVVDRLYELGFDNVYPVNFSQKALESDRYANVVTEMFFKLREMMANGEVQLKPNEELKRDLLAMEYFFDSGGRLKVVNAHDLKKGKLGRSPDRAVSVALRFAPVRTGLVFTI